MRRIVVILVSTALALGVFGMAPPAQAANNWDGISWYWIKNPRCGYLACWQIKVKASRVSCPEGLFVTLDEKNRSGDIVGNPIDSVNSLRRGQTAILTFYSTYEGSSTGSVSEMNCFD